MIKKYKEFLLLEKINETDFLNDLNKISEDNDVAKFRVKMKGYRKEVSILKDIIQILQMIHQQIQKLILKKCKHF